MGYPRALAAQRGVSRSFAAPPLRSSDDDARARRAFKGGLRRYDASAMHRSRRVIGITAVCVVLAGCASATSSVADNGQPATALRAAVEKTLGVDSFHAQATFQEPSGRGPGTGTIDYQAPDHEDERFGNGKREHETISIGNTVYITANKPGYFWKIEGRGVGATDTLSYLHLLQHAENVSLDGNLYHFDLPS